MRTYCIISPLTEKGVENSKKLLIEIEYEFGRRNMSSTVNADQAAYVIIFNEILTKENKKYLANMAADYGCIGIFVDSDKDITNMDLLEFNV